jgi:hypothetical protein
MFWVLPDTGEGEIELICGTTGALHLMVFGVLPNATPAPAKRMPGRS